MSVTITTTTAAARRLAKPPRPALDWVARVVGPRAAVIDVEPLTGGVSHASHIVRVRDDGGRMIDLVLRRWVRPEWRVTDPQFTPEQEATTLGLLASSSVPAPRLVAADPEAIECDVPAILTTRAAGSRLTSPTDLFACVRQLAEALPALHAIDPAVAARTVPAYRPYSERGELRPPPWTSRPGLWEAAIELATAEGPAGERSFIHRDYHPGNTLWLNERLSAIVDWTNASFGSPSVDLAHMRANLAMSFDQSTADAFLAAHEVASASRLWHPYWDLRVAVDFLPDPPSTVDASLRRLEVFVERALTLLGRPSL